MKEARAAMGIDQVWLLSAWLQFAVYCLVSDFSISYLHPAVYPNGTLALFLRAET
jgi:hypothetical protein